MICSSPAKNKIEEQIMGWVNTMLSCVYTTQKTKKLKKWIDGFIIKKGSGLILYNEERKAIHRCTSFTVLEDSTIETSMYLVCAENLEEFMRETQNQECASEYNLKYSKKTSLKLNESSENADRHTTFMLDQGENKRLCDNNEKSKGRSVEDILSLFQKQ
ncbi:uncharacterized protein VICG_02074 [Vittaforma corneae ATCC 50505]|uniref:5'-3' DNA helicase ZGRF1-like N-terminal domain-containing protein n=1 Tax=Vittaforma corneae (strain ATCC 50505) TaxID=993615 RepID=L2GJT1_VITCO|nr:uncharacterized protein VICG_02074 [Vittaforma corneae ATCC 50505]ELA40894.1 hypothetical protein VICG_02074 [Vittaforma corneae ATCC 50505]